MNEQIHVLTQKLLDDKQVSDLVKIRFFKENRKANHENFSKFQIC